MAMGRRTQGAGAQRRSWPCDGRGEGEEETARGEEGRGAGRDTNTLKIRFITFLLRFRGGTTKGCPG